MFSALPLHYGVAGGELIRETTYMVVLFSITFTALLVMIYPNRLTQRGYAFLMSKDAQNRDDV